jgi:hypothetical protein
MLIRAEFERIGTGALRLRQVLARELIARCGTRRQPPFLCARPYVEILDAHRGIAVGDESFTGNERGSPAVRREAERSGGR